MPKPLLLEDRIISVLSTFDEPPMARDVAAAIVSEEAAVRRAFERLESSGKAKIVRRGRGLHLVPADWPVPMCIVCRAEFERPRKSKRVTCCRSCAVSLSWKNPDTKQQRVASIKDERQTEEARARAIRNNKKRWSRPGEREKLSERNRQMWADPYENAKMSVAIQKVQLTPERREFQSKQIKSRWDDPKGREKLVRGIRNSKSTPEARAKFSRLLRERWQDPEWREKYLAATRKNSAKGAEKTRGKKQSEEQIAKRVASTSAARSARKSDAD